MMWRREDHAMSRRHLTTSSLIAVTAVASCWFLLTARGSAHCDSMRGPVVVEARSALEKGNVTPVLKWIKKDHEAEVRTVFGATLAVRGKGPEARDLADRFFFETLVRLHRAGEGAPYTGLKDEPIDPVVAMADKALTDGSADEMIRKISDHMAAAIGEKFERALATKKAKDTSVDAGREFVEAYVTYMHHVEAIHAAIVSESGHEHEGAAETAARLAPEDR